MRISDGKHSWQNSQGNMVEFTSTDTQKQTQFINSSGFGHAGSLFSTSMVRATIGKSCIKITNKRS